MSEFQIAIENFLLIEPPVVAEEKKDTKTNNSNSMMPNSLGALSENFSSPNNDNGKFYITTAIAYTNGLPHIGHAYEFLSADVLARFHRLFGENTYFLTGSDEHGQKVANSAEKAGKAPIDHCNFYVEAFQHLNKRLVVSNNKYIRTTDSIHKETAQKLWTICAANDDIYLDKYEGWYNEREENFVTDADAEANNFIDPGNGIPLKRVIEESYFFRMSKFCDRLIAHIETNPSFIEPEMHRNSILTRLKKEGLKDLCISRTAFTWGIPMPTGFNANHVMYVWFDALSNYLSGICALDSKSDLASFWPASLHIIGKDIIWFHTVIWPCMLFSAQIPLPAKVFAHGFVNAQDGRKMSKSYNNSVDPNEILDFYSVDSVRYYLSACTTYGQDVNFSEASLITMHNCELADVLGNLVHRIFNLCDKYCGGKIPDVKHDEKFPLPFDLKLLQDETNAALNSCLINVALSKAMEAARSTNRFLTEAEPWKMKGVDESRRPSIVRTTLEAVYVFMHFLAPVIPLTAEVVFERLNTSPIISRNLKSDFYNLRPGTEVVLGDILFRKIE